MRRLFPLSLMVLSLTGGCTLLEPQEPLDGASYQAGYGQGCNTGQARQNAYSNYVDRDENRYSEDRSYRAGWNAGLRACRGTIGDPYGRNPGSLGGPGSSR